MKVLVAVKQVADPGASIRFGPGGSALDLAGVRMTINPFDEVAIEEAVRGREGGLVREVVAITLGAEKAKEVLRHALATGADRAIHILTEADLEPLHVAKLLRSVAIEEQVDVVLLGKQASDDDNGQTGPMLAGLLGWPQATFAVRVKFADGELEVGREVDGGLDVVRLRLPAVVTADLRLNEPRYASLPNIMRAKAKPISIRHSEDFGVDLTRRVTVLGYEYPTARKPGVRVSSAVELVAALRSRGAVP
jgi:electron transfer flavoprotein beta subunit